ncbi:UNVERIFIED_ORG: hypothetical protein J2791_001530 [Burkholderia contaminans]|nr:hypothetical protein [Burkholderia contaminans]
MFFSALFFRGHPNLLSGKPTSQHHLTTFHTSH